MPRASRSPRRKSPPSTSRATTSIRNGTTPSHPDPRQINEALIDAYVLSKVAGDDLLQPFPLLGDRLMHPSPQLFLDVLELRPLAIPTGFPVDPEITPARGAADEGEAQEGEGFRLAEA